MERGAGSSIQAVAALSAAAQDLAEAAQRLATEMATAGQANGAGAGGACSGAGPGTRLHRLLAAIDPDCRRRFVDDVAGGILALPASQRDTLLATVAALGTHRHRVQCAARALHVDPRTVRNRAARIRRLTGLDAGAEELRLALFLLELSETIRPAPPPAPGPAAPPAGPPARG